MGLRDRFKKTEDDGDHDGPSGADSHETENNVQIQHATAVPPPEFTFVRTDTVSQDVINPTDGHDNSAAAHIDESHLAPSRQPSKSRRSMDFFRSSRSRSDSASSATSHNSSTSTSRRRLSQRLHLVKQPESSEHVPQNLPDIVLPANAQDKDGMELQWEKRATILAEQNELARSRPNSPAVVSAPGSPNNANSHHIPNLADSLGSISIDDRLHPRASSESPARPSSTRSRSPSANSQTQPVSSKAIDADIQEAIRLHEAGDYPRSTQIFGRLADEQGANNALSQVLYGLALRHGWGCEPDPQNAVKYLSAAASNAASVEQLALQAGLKKGGAAKGELVLAIFELANCFRHGWGIQKDAIAAKQVCLSPPSSLQQTWLQTYILTRCSITKQQPTWVTQVRFLSLYMYLPS